MIGLPIEVLPDPVLVFVVPRSCPILEEFPVK